MTVSEAKEILKNIKDRTPESKLKNRIGGIIFDLTNWFGCSDEIDNKSIVRLLKNADSSIGKVDSTWITKLTALLLNEKRWFECKNEIDKNNKKIDGETAQWWTTILQGIIGLVSVVFTVLFALGKIPNIFGVLGEDKNTDALYYIIGTVGQQAVALLLAIIIGICNRRGKKKKYRGKDLSFEELMAVKYEDKTRILKILSPTAAIIASGKGKVAGGDIIEKGSTEVKDSYDAVVCSNLKKVKNKNGNVHIGNVYSSNTNEKK